MIARVRLAVLQKLLSITDNGTFGELTENYVRDFQARHHIGEAVSLLELLTETPDPITGEFDSKNSAAPTNN